MHWFIVIFKAEIHASVGERETPHPHLLLDKPITLIAAVEAPSADAAAQSVTDRMWDIHVADTVESVVLDNTCARFSQPGEVDKAEITRLRGVLLPLLMAKCESKLGKYLPCWNCDGTDTHQHDCLTVKRVREEAGALLNPDALEREDW